MKQSMSSQLFLCINNCNKILGLVNAKLDKQHRIHGGGIIRCKDKDSKETFQNGAGPAGASYRDGGPANSTALNSPSKKTNPNLLENGKSSRKRSVANGSLPE
jgi:hypothetical protein